VETVGIIAFAFGKQKTELGRGTGPSNESIGETAVDVAGMERRRGNKVLLSGQWETTGTKALQNEEVFEVSHFEDDPNYIKTKDVIIRSVRYFKQNGAQRLIIVAHPLHRPFIEAFIRLRLYKIDGLRLNTWYNSLMARIPYDRTPGNEQWWTRNGFLFIVYLVRSVFTGIHGK